MRNDFPDHPSGPLKHDPNPADILEIKKNPTDAYIVMGLGILSFVVGLVMIFSGKEFLRLPGGGLALMGAVIFLLTDQANEKRKLVMRIRPDGIEFPRDGTPPLRWQDIQSVDLAILNIIGGGGEHDYLGIILKPGLNYPKSGDISGKLTQLYTRWNFDICYAMAELDRPVPHVVMEMRSRAEAAALAPPVAPKDLPPIQSEAIANAPRPKRMRRSWLLLGIGALIGLAAAIGGGNALMKLSSGITHSIRADGSQGQAYTNVLARSAIGFLIAFVCNHFSKQEIKDS